MNKAVQKSDQKFLALTRVFYRMRNVSRNTVKLKGVAYKLGAAACKCISSQYNVGTTH